LLGVARVDDIIVAIVAIAYIDFLLVLRTTWVQACVSVVSIVVAFEKNMSAISTDQFFIKPYGFVDLIRKVSIGLIRKITCISFFKYVISHYVKNMNQSDIMPFRVFL
jgi:hypothetical protein